MKQHADGFASSSKSLPKETCEMSSQEWCLISQCTMWTPAIVKFNIGIYSALEPCVGEKDAGKIRAFLEANVLQNKNKIIYFPDF